MTTKPIHLSTADQKGYADYYKKQYKRMNFNGDYYCTIFKNAVKQYEIHRKEVDDYLESIKKLGITTIEWFLKSKE